MFPWSSMEIWPSSHMSSRSSHLVNVPDFVLILSVGTCSLRRPSIFLNSSTSRGSLRNFGAKKTMIDLRKYKPYWKNLSKPYGFHPHPNYIIPFFEKLVVNHALSGTRGLATPLAVCLPSASKAKHPAQWPSIQPTLTSIVRCKAKQLVQAFHLFIGNPMALRKNQYRTQSIYTHLSFINMLTYLGCLGARSKNWIIRSKGLSSWAPGSTEGSSHNGLWGVIELGNSTEG